MKFGVFSFLLSVALMQEISAESTWAFKCGTSMFMCGEGLDVTNICLNPGVSAYIPKTLQECDSMIAAAKTMNGITIAATKCPTILKNGKWMQNSISHFEEYKSCNMPTVTKYNSGPAVMAPETCYCGESGKGQCGPSTCSGGGGGSVGGDPHFKTHDGTLYSFHGECDLVMAQSPSFSNGLGLDVHARTEMIGNTWSLVSNAAVRIGNDVFEVNNNGTHYINGVANVILPTHFSTEFEIQYSEEIVNDGENSIRSWYTVEMGNGEKIQITNYKKMISVNVEVKGSDMKGMLGSTGKPGLIGRDGQMEITDPDEMGSQWQVNDEEPMLFNDIRSPQYPEACKLPEVSMRHRRLGAVGEIMASNAKAACSGVAENLYNFCLYDVMISGKVELAQTYNGGVF